MPATAYYLGLDLGQAQDYTALAILEGPGREVPGSWPVTRMHDGGSPRDVPGVYHGPGAPLLPRPRSPTQLPAVFHCRHLERLPLGTNYLRVVEYGFSLMNRPPLKGATTLAVDATGVGAPVMDLFRHWGLQPHGILIHGGDSVTQTGRDFRCPKRDLIACVQTLLQQRRLKFAAGLAHAETLAAELAGYTVALSPSGHDSYNARSGEHDDLVLALAVACWIANRRTPAPRAEPSPKVS